MFTSLSLFEDVAVSIHFPTSGPSLLSPVVPLRDSVLHLWFWQRSTCRQPLHWRCERLHLPSVSSPVLLYFSRELTLSHRVCRSPALILSDTDAQTGSLVFYRTCYGSCCQCVLVEHQTRERYVVLTVIGVILPYGQTLVCCIIEDLMHFNLTYVDIFF